MKAFARVAAILLFSSFVFQLQALSQNFNTGFLKFENGRFIDQQGRTVILNGINHVTKSAELNFLNANDEVLFKNFKAWGFNCIRYGIIWAGLEPEPGKINEAYLKEIDKRVKWAEENGVWLFLDMHQDLYSQEFSDGAPKWATLTDDEPHNTGEIWSEAYLISPAVQRVFDNFWANKPASDGVGIQDHYIRLWETIARRYASSPSVIGFDVMNEPFPGSQANNIVGKVLTYFGEKVAEKTGKAVSEEELMAVWGDPAKRMEAINSMSDKKSYQALAASMEEEVGKFEKNTLSAFYQKLRDAIRKSNSKQALFLEHNYFCNLGIKSNFKIPVDEQGKPDQNIVYAPHGYDLVVDTDMADKPGTERVEVIFETIFASGKRMNTPVVVGEWGAFYTGENKYFEACQQIIDLFENNLVGQTYWCYMDNIEKQDCFKLISRAYPAATSGELISYKNDFMNNGFSLSWRTRSTDLSTPTVIYIPNIKSIDPSSLKNKDFNFELTPITGQQAGYLKIKPKKAGTHSYSFTVK